ncbi:diguanylate cyclase (GGDEF)-like protein/PAS domain S-box-containing protein [Hydrogenophaga laconesensis]|uniref:Diguanylate cyclase (GGDEF)-like protein/PAS domain S-box-containing protein n=1 Tax=Hydrogenophaga laconesensis TaxID=1805971 RepID=A0ABU1V7J8_9BURK|nr:diguanylate cyclase (GGDEF)-like protein/PAS domain S-box-containing protein [Hydrogenophaga laconesensis]
MRPAPDNRPPLNAEPASERTGAWMVPTQRSELDRLTQMAAQFAAADAALLVDMSHEPPLLLGSHGLTPEETTQSLGACAPLLKTRTDSERVLAEAEAPFRYRHWLPVFDVVGQSGLLLLGRDAREPVSDATLQLLAQHAADVLALARRCEQSEQYNANVLRESESRLNLTEHTAGAGSWSLQLSTREVVHSDEFATILGLTGRHQIRSLEDMVQRYAPEWRNGIRQRLERCAQQGEGFDEEIQVVVDGGVPKWVRTVGTAVRRANGQIVRIQGAIQDISAQKQAQQDTLRLAMRLTTTLASITEAFVTLDRQCCFTYLNQESERLLQKSTADLLGLEVWQGFSAGLAQRLKDQLTRSLNTNRRVELEDFFPTLGKWLEVRAYPFAEGLAVYFRDVTERRRSQEQLMLLETSVSRLNDIVAIAETGAGTNDTEPRIVFVNDAFEQHTGYSRAEVLGQTPRMLLELDPAIPKLRELALGLQQTQQARTELMVRRKNGAMFWVELEVVSVQATAEEVTHWVAVGRDITQRKTAEDMIRHLAFYDALTDLPNRQLLLDRLQQALAASARSGQHGALMFIDLDNFKILNDTLGHQMGDQLLQKVAARLTKSVRKTDMVARLGGDEFVVMVDDLSTDPDAAAFKATALAEKVLNTLREPFQLNGHQHFTTPSIGVTSFNGQQNDVGELLKQADLAMYQAKSLGRNTLCFFDPNMQATVTANATVGSDLRVALNEEQFVVHYQPQVDRVGVITGVEALVRWQHPQRGLIFPADFIPVAEDTGLILPLGQWVLEKSCEQLAAWADRPQTSNLSIAVNVSVRQFRHPDFVDMVMAAITRTGIRPHRLKLELTESLLADRMEITIDKMGMLKALGVTLSLDDFGVGYSSLSVLKRLPLDQLKIDKGFVADVLTDPNDAAISRAIIALAQSLSLQVVAEGVETQEQRDFLAYQGCDQFQGHLFAKPLPIEALDALLQNPTAGMLVLA